MVNASAEILDSRVLGRADGQGHDVMVSHVRTKASVATVRSEGPKDAPEDWFFLSGWAVGGAYTEAACAVADDGNIGRTIRHGSNAFNGALEAVAYETSRVIEVLAQDRTVHVVAHSKAGRVAVTALADVDENIDIGSLTIVNSPQSRIRYRDLPAFVLGGAVELAAVGVIHPPQVFGMLRGTSHELRHRLLGVLGEAKDLFTEPSLQDKYKKLRDRGVQTVKFEGSFDHLVPQNISSPPDLDHQYDREVRKKGPVNGGHFGIIANRNFLKSA